MNGNTLCRKCQYAFGYGSADKMVGYDESCGGGSSNRSSYGGDGTASYGGSYGGDGAASYGGSYGGDGSEPSCLLDCEQFGLPSGCGFCTKPLRGSKF